MKISGAGTSQDFSRPVSVPSPCPSEVVSRGVPSDILSLVSNSEESDTLSDIDESDLGEFLLETFEEVDPLTISA